MYVCDAQKNNIKFGKNKIINYGPSGVQNKDDLNFSYLTGDL